MSKVLAVISDGFKKTDPKIEWAEPPEGYKLPPIWKRLPKVRIYWEKGLCMNVIIYGKKLVTMYGIYFERKK